MTGPPKPPPPPPPPPNEATTRGAPLPGKPGVWSCSLCQRVAITAACWALVLLAIVWAIVGLQAVNWLRADLCARFGQCERAPELYERDR